MIEAIQEIITEFIGVGQDIFEEIFGNIQFNVLWSWLPQDIQSTAQTFIVILFIISLIKGIRTFLPF